MTQLEKPAVERIRPLLRVRQMREFTDAPVTKAELDAIADVARWSGSSSNSQPWRFVLISDAETLRALGEAGKPQTRGLLTASAAIAVVLPVDEGHSVSLAYDEGRAVERIMIAASALGLGSGISWVLPGVRDRIHSILGVPAGRMVRTIVAIGHPTENARRPKSEPGKARLPRNEVVFEGGWPKG
jgi:nitroreductase